MNHPWAFSMPVGAGHYVKFYPAVVIIQSKRTLREILPISGGKFGGGGGAKETQAAVQLPWLPEPD